MSTQMGRYLRITLADGTTYIQELDQLHYLTDRIYFGAIGTTFQLEIIEMPSSNFDRSASLTSYIGDTLKCRTQS